MDTLATSQCYYQARISAKSVLTRSLNQAFLWRSVPILTGKKQEQNKPSTMAGFVVVMVVNVLLLGSAIYLMFFADPDRCVVCCCSRERVKERERYNKRDDGRYCCCT